MIYDYGTYHEIAIDPGIGTAIIHRPETRDLILAQRSGELPGLVMTNIWKITIMYGKIQYKIYTSPFSIAMLVITRGYLSRWINFEVNFRGLTKGFPHWKSCVFLKDREIIPKWP